MELVVVLLRQGMLPGIQVKERGDVFTAEVDHD
jgi:hypothetical protein